MSEETESPEEESAEEEEGKAKGGSKLLLIIGLVAGLALGAGGMFFASGMLADDETGEEEEVAEEEPEEEEAPPPNILTVEIKRINVPLVDANKRVLGYMWVDAEFEVIGPEAQAELSRRKARVRDALIRALHSQPTTRSDRPGALDFDLVTKELTDAASGVLAEGALNRVNLSNAQRAPL